MKKLEFKWHHIVLKCGLIALIYQIGPFTLQAQREQPYLEAEYHRSAPNQNYEWNQETQPAFWPTDIPQEYNSYYSAQPEQSFDWQGMSTRNQFEDENNSQYYSPPYSANSQEAFFEEQREPLSNQYENYPNQQFDNYSITSEISSNDSPYLQSPSQQVEVITQWDANAVQLPPTSYTTSNQTIPSFSEVHSPDLSLVKEDVIINKKTPPPFAGAIEVLKEENKFEIVGNQNHPFVSVGHVEPVLSEDIVIVNENDIDSSENKTPVQNPFKTLYKDKSQVSQIVYQSPNAFPLSSNSSPSEFEDLIAQVPVLPPSSSTTNSTTIQTPIPSSAPIAEPIRTSPVAAPVRLGTNPALIHKNEPATVTGVREISINFNNVAMIEFIRFISRITGKNFIFDDVDLQFNVTIISEEPTTLDNLMAALLQELRIRGLSLIEQGNNLIIHRNPRVRAPAHIVAEGIPVHASENELVTRVFRLNTLDPIKASEIIRPLLSEDALIEVLRDSNNLIITDLVANVNKIAQLITSLDAPNSGMTIGQYVVRNAFVDSLAVLAERILQPIAQGNPFIFVPHPPSNSIFIVSNSFIVERALAILENLDMNEGKTKIFTLDKLKLRDGVPGASGTGPGGAGNGPGAIGSGPGGNGPGLDQDRVPEGMYAGPDGKFYPIQPQDRLPLSSGGFVPPDLNGNPDFSPGSISSGPRWMRDLPAGHIERTVFFIHKLKYRRGDQIVIALRKIASSLLLTGMSNADLVGAIDSIQWLESTNSLIFTGTPAALDRVRELVEEIDLPLRQVFIEMLILETTINDALNYGVEWGSRFGGGNTAGSEAFLASGSSPLLAGLDSAGTVSLTPTDLPIIGPSAAGLARTAGFSLGVIGKHLTKNGTQFNSIGALVTAIHTDAKTRVLMNPKIITEDNHTAEIFVGSTDRYKTQSISNDLGNVITNNFQFIDVGTTLRVTPLIGTNDVITLDIIQEITSENLIANLTSAGTTTDFNLIPVLNKNRTLTRAHVPNGFFIIISGMINDTRATAVNRVPCLGGIPFIGAANKQQGATDAKHNLMIFIRPVIIDTEDELEYLTKRQQDVYREKGKFNRLWNYEIDEAMNFLNLKPTDPDEIGCTIK